MSVTVRPYRRGGWEVDVQVQLPDGTRHRERKKTSVTSKTAAVRWAEDRERHLLRFGPPKPKKEVPTLNKFASRFVDGHARANRQKPSGIASKEMILRVHLLPALGHKRLDAISNEDVQRLKHGLQAKSPKTVNNVLAVLSKLLKVAVEWNVIERMPCTMRLLRVDKSAASFHDFEQYERLVNAARDDSHALLIVLLGGEAGLRLGEMIALEWSDVDLAKRQLCVQRADWNGEVNSTKGGRIRYVPLTNRLATTLREHRHLRSPRVLCHKDGTGLTRQYVQSRVLSAARRANVKNGVHILRHTFCSHLAMRGAPAKAIQELAGHQDLSMTQRYMHLSPAALDAAIRLLDGRGRGDMLETAAVGSCDLGNS
jgi:integrase